MCGVGTKDGKIEKQVMDINNEKFYRKFNRCW
jgi:hypothetical protein